MIKDSNNNKPIDLKKLNVFSRLMAAELIWTVNLWFVDLRRLSHLLFWSGLKLKRLKVQTKQAPWNIINPKLFTISSGFSFKPVRVTGLYLSVKPFCPSALPEHNLREGTTSVSSAKIIIFNKHIASSIYESGPVGWMDGSWLHITEALICCSTLDKHSDFFFLKHQADVLENSRPEEK